MRLPTDPKREKLAIGALLIGGLPLTVLGPIVGENNPGLTFVFAVALLLMLGFALVYVRRIPRLVLSGLIGGGLAGLIILGGGSRLAMRIVSLTGGRREMTIDGTAFLLIFGAFAGANLGLILAAAGRMRRYRVRSAVLVVGALGAIGFFGLFGPEVRDEIFHEGLGVWLNAPLFLSLFPAYAWGAVRAIRYLEQRLPGRAWGRRLDIPVPEPATSS